MTHATVLSHGARQTHDGSCIKATWLRALACRCGTPVHLRDVCCLGASAPRYVRATRNASPLEGRSPSLRPLK